MFTSTTHVKRSLGRRALATTAAAILVGGAIMAVGNTSAIAAPSKPQSGGTLVFLTSATRSDDLYLAAMVTDYRDFTFLNSFLTRTLETYAPVPGPDGSGLIANTQLVPDLATNTGVSTDDAKTWKFTLRPGSTFEDGKAITCSDVKYGLSRVFATDVITGGIGGYAIQWIDIPKDANGNSIYKGPYTVDSIGQAAYDNAVTCDNTDRTITIHLNTPVADFNNLASTGVLSPVEKAMDTDPAAYEQHPLATGPYKVESNTTASLVLIRNGNWSQASDPVRTPYPDRIEVRYGLDSNNIDQIMADASIPNAVNYDNPLSTNLSKFFDTSTGQPLASMAGRAINYTNPFVFYLAVNVKKMPCLEVREAFYLARDAQANLDAIGGLAFGGSYATGIVSPSVTTDYAPTGIAGPGSSDFIPTGNIAKAQALLEIAKTKCPAEYIHATQTGIVIDIGPNQLANRQGTVDDNIAAYARAGIRVSYNIIQQNYYGQIVDPTNQHDVSFLGWGADWPDASTVIPNLLLTTGNSFDLSQNGDDPNYATFAANVAKAMATKNDQQRAKLWKELDKQAMSYFWLLPNVFGKSQFVTGPGVGGVSLWAPQGALSYTKLWLK